MNPFLAIGQIIVSIALIAAILLQARGTGLSGTFGGDSAVYRSRRGVERRRRGGTGDGEGGEQRAHEPIIAGAA